jgi:hypothetical protein
MRVYHYLEAHWALDDLRRRRLKISDIHETNDPYEFACVRSEDKRSQRTLDAFARDWVKDYRVHCFSRSWNNILMWSHYGQKHKGICLGFDVPEGCVRDITYVDQVMLIGTLHKAVANENGEILERLIWAKYCAWSYEQEVRLIGRGVNMSQESGMFFVSFGQDLQLKEVIAGSRFSMGRTVIDEALDGYAGVAVTKAKCSDTGFEVVTDCRGFADAVAL